MMTTITEEKTLDYQPSQISWGAVIAGLLFVVAFSWLMFLLGSAIGFSIADATDLDAMDSGLPIGTVVWMLLTTIVSFFLGGLLAGRLAGKPEKTVGMFHGIAVWSGSTILLIVLGYAGVANIMQGAQALVQGTFTAGNAAGSAISSGAAQLGSMVTSADDLASSGNPIVNTITAQLKRKAAEIFTEMDAPGGVDVSQQNVRQAFKQVDNETLKEIGAQLVQGNPQSAKDTLAAETDLSSKEIDNLIEGITQEFAQELGISSPGGDTAAIAERIQERLTSKLSSLVASADDAGGHDITQQKVEQTLPQLDVQTLQSVAVQLVQGNTEAAKDVLVVNTDLTDKDIESLIDGISKEIEEPIQQFKQEANKFIETASDYTQAVLWASFIMTAIGLLVAIAGGWVGSDSVKRIYAVQRKIET